MKLPVQNLTRVVLFKNDLKKKLSSKKQKWVKIGKRAAQAL